MSDVPVLELGDIVRVYGYPSDTFEVVGFRVQGMLVDCARFGDGQVFCVPRRQAVGGWLRAMGSDDD